MSKTLTDVALEPESSSSTTKPPSPPSPEGGRSERRGWRLSRAGGSFRSLLNDVKTRSKPPIGRARPEAIEEFYLQECDVHPEVLVRADRFVLELRHVPSGRMLFLSSRDCAEATEWLHDLRFVQSNGRTAAWLEVFAESVRSHFSPRPEALAALPHRDWHAEWSAATADGADLRQQISLQQQFRWLVSAVASCIARRCGGHGWPGPILAPWRPLCAAADGSSGTTIAAAAAARDERGTGSSSSGDNNGSGGDSADGSTRTAFGRDVEDGGGFSFVLDGVFFAAVPNTEGYAQTKRLGHQAAGLAYLAATLARLAHGGVLDALGSGAPGQDEKPRRQHQLPLTCIVDVLGYRVAATALPGGGEAGNVAALTAGATAGAAAAAAAPAPEAVASGEVARLPRLVAVNGTDALGAVLARQLRLTATEQCRLVSATAVPAAPGSDTSNNNRSGSGSSSVAGDGSAGGHGSPRLGNGGDGGGDVDAAGAPLVLLFPDLFPPEVVGHDNAAVTGLLVPADTSIPICQTHSLEVAGADAAAAANGAAAAAAAAAAGGGLSRVATAGGSAGSADAAADGGGAIGAGGIQRPASAAGDSSPQEAAEAAAMTATAARDATLRRAVAGLLEVADTCLGCIAVNAYGIDLYYRRGAFKADRFGPVRPLNERATVLAGRRLFGDVFATLSQEHHRARRPAPPAAPLGAILALKSRLPLRFRPELLERRSRRGGPMAVRRGHQSSEPGSTNRGVEASESAASAAATAAAAVVAAAGSSPSGDAGSGSTEAEEEGRLLTESLHLRLKAVPALAARLIGCGTLNAELLASPALATMVPAVTSKAAAAAATAAAAAAAAAATTATQRVYVFHGEQLCALLHEAGINLRYLPAVSEALATDQLGLRHLIAAEVLARAAKRLLACKYREALLLHDGTSRVVPPLRLPSAAAAAMAAVEAGGELRVVTGGTAAAAAAVAAATAGLGAGTRAAGAATPTKRVTFAAGTREGAEMRAPAPMGAPGPPGATVGAGQRSRSHSRSATAGAVLMSYSGAGAGSDASAYPADGAVAPMAPPAAAGTTEESDSTAFLSKLSRGIWGERLVEVAVEFLNAVLWDESAATAAAAGDLRGSGWGNGGTSGNAQAAPESGVDGDGHARYHNSSWQGSYASDSAASSDDGGSSTGGGSSGAMWGFASSAPRHSRVRSSPFLSGSILLGQLEGPEQRAARAEARAALIYSGGSGGSGGSASSDGARSVSSGGSGGSWEGQLLAPSGRLDGGAGRVFLAPRGGAAARAAPSAPRTPAAGAAPLSLPRALRRQTVADASKTFWEVESRLWLVLGPSGSVGGLKLGPSHGRAHICDGMMPLQLLPALLRCTATVLTAPCLRRAQEGGAVPRLTAADVDSAGIAAPSATGCRFKGATAAAAALKAQIRARAVANCEAAAAAAGGYGGGLGGAVAVARAYSILVDRVYGPSMGRSGGNRGGGGGRSGSGVSADAWEDFESAGRAAVAEARLQHALALAKADVLSEAAEQAEAALTTLLPPAQDGGGALPGGLRPPSASGFPASTTAFASGSPAAAAMHQAPAYLLVGGVALLSVLRAEQQRGSAAAGTLSCARLSLRRALLNGNGNGGDGDGAGADGGGRGFADGGWRSDGSVSPPRRGEVTAPRPGELLWLWRVLQVLFPSSGDGQSMTVWGSHPLVPTVALLLDCAAKGSVSSSSADGSHSCGSDGPETEPATAAAAPARPEWLRRLLETTVFPSSQLGPAGIAHAAEPALRMTLHVLRNSGLAAGADAAAWQTPCSLLLPTALFEWARPSLDAAADLALASVASVEAAPSPAASRRREAASAFMHGGSAVLLEAAKQVERDALQAQGRVFIDGKILGLSLEDEHVRRLERLEGSGDAGADPLSPGGGSGGGNGGGSGDSGDSRTALATASSRSRLDLFGVRLPAEWVVRHVACGYRHAALLTASGALLTVGLGEAGRLGHGDEEDAPAPRIVRALLDGRRRVVAAACGRQHTMCVAADGAVFGFGWGEGGCLGLGDVGSVLLPQAVPSVDSGALGAIGARVVDVACGLEHSLLLTSAGQLLACGHGTGGRLGLGSEAGVLQPEAVLLGGLDGERVVFAAAGAMHSACVCESGALFTWGNGEKGQLGHGDFDDSLVPRRVANFAAVAASHNGSPTRGGGSGSGGCGSIGDSRASTTSTAKSGGGGGFGGAGERGGSSSGLVANVACGDWHTLALTVEGRILAFGDGWAGQLGLIDRGGLEESRTAVPRLVRLPPLLGPRRHGSGGSSVGCSSVGGGGSGGVDRGEGEVRARQVACGNFTSAAVSVSGDLYCWGVADACYEDKPVSSPAELLPCRLIGADGGSAEAGAGAGVRFEAVARGGYLSLAISDEMVYWSD